MMPIETTVNEIEYIKEMLPLLSETTLHELRTFMDYLADRERRHRELVERIRKAEKNPDSIICNSVDEAMQAIYNTPDNNDEA
jgi:rubrerythrin